MKKSEIETALINGQVFGNEAADWFSLSKPAEKRFMLFVNGDIVASSLKDVTNKIYILIKKGSL